ncbi:MAG: hypothetical protein ACUVWX_08225, partial [Kiritimatiellia bacterium]
CLRNATAPKAARNHVNRERPYAGPQADMTATGAALQSYYALYDLTADRAWLEEAMSLFRTNVVAKWKACGPHLHGSTQIAGQEYIKDDMRYCYAIQSLCELHSRTNDEKLVELLLKGCETEFPATYYEAPPPPMMNVSYDECLL